MSCLYLFSELRNKYLNVNIYVLFYYYVYKHYTKVLFMTCLESSIDFLPTFVKYSMLLQGVYYYGPAGNTKSDYLVSPCSTS